MNANRILIPLIDGDLAKAKQPTPDATGWQRPDFDPSRLTFGTNRAWRLDGLTRVDPDCPEARAFAPALLFHTGLVSARPSTGANAYYYEGEIEPHVMCWKDIDGTKLIEVMSGPKHYGVVPPSIVPIDKDDLAKGGEAIEWQHERGPGKVELTAIPASARLVAIAAIVARHWPKENRHDLTLAFAGLMCKLGVHADDARRILERVTQYTEGQVWSDAHSSVADTYAKIAEGKKARGGPELAKVLLNDGPAVVALIKEWFGVGATKTIDQVVSDMNARHFLVRVGKKYLVGMQHPDDASEPVTFHEPAELRKKYANDFVLAGAKPNGDPIFKTAFDVWFHSAHRREHRKVVFAPPPASAHAGDFNLWTGFAVTPDTAPHPEERCARYLALVRDVICGGVAEYAEYLLDLLAWKIQNPGAPPIGPVIVMRSHEGYGKGTFAQGMIRLFGPRHAIQLDDPDHALGKFNVSLSGKCLVFLDEAFWSGERQSFGAMKRLATERTIVIERKGIDPIEEPNTLLVMLATNNEWAWPAGISDRRGFVLDIAQSRSPEYYAAVYAEMDHGGDAALLAYLQQRPVTRDLRQVPKTAALDTQKDLTLEPHAAWWKECLMDGAIEGVPWPEKITSGDFHKAYLDFAKTLSPGRLLTGLELGHRMSAWLEGKQDGKAYDYLRNEHGHIIVGALDQVKGRKRNRGFYLPALSKARRTWEETTAQRVSWPDPDRDGEPGQSDPVSDPRNSLFP